MAQLNRVKGPEFRPDESVDSSSSASDSTHGNSAEVNEKTSIKGALEAVTARQRQEAAKAVNQSFDSSSISSGDIAAPLDDNRQQAVGNIYIHLDMDAFYASALINRRFPHLKNSPVVVVPAKSTNNGTSEIASANYVAREYGIRARMFVSEARKLCDKLEVLQVDYVLFEDTSARMYEQILRYTHTVEAVSADEAYLDVTPWGWERVKDLAQRIQNDVSRATSCPCSIGAGPNKLIARLSTTKAKPSGIVVTTPQESAEFLKPFPCSSLPGVGGATASKLTSKGINIVSELLNVEFITLQSWFGEKTGKKLFDFARAIDARPLQMEQERKSVGTQISWGVRMVTNEQVLAFLRDLTAEVCKRLSEIQMIGARVSLRVLKKIREIHLPQVPESRVIDARMGGIGSEQVATVPKGESAKAFNPGQCTQLSKSTKIAFATADVSAITREIHRLYKTFDLSPTDFRGAGISIDDLQPESSQSKNSSIRSFFRKSPEQTQEETTTDPNELRKPGSPQHSTDPNSMLQEPPTSLLSHCATSTSSQLLHAKRQHHQMISQPSAVRSPPSPPSISKSNSACKGNTPSPKKQATITSMWGKKS